MRASFVPVLFTVICSDRWYVPPRTHRMSPACNIPIASAASPIGLSMLEPSPVPPGAR